TLRERIEKARIRRWLRNVKLRRDAVEKRLDAEAVRCLVEQYRDTPAAVCNRAPIEHGVAEAVGHDRATDHRRALRDMRSMPDDGGGARRRESRRQRSRFGRRQ